MRDTALFPLSFPEAIDHLASPDALERFSHLTGAETIDTSFPGFVALLRSLGADITEEIL